MEANQLRFTPTDVVKLIGFVAGLLIHYYSMKMEFREQMIRQQSQIESTQELAKQTAQRLDAYMLKPEEVQVGKQQK